MANGTPIYCTLYLSTISFCFVVNLTTSMPYSHYTRIKKGMEKGKKLDLPSPIVVLPSVCSALSLETRSALS